MSPPGRPKGELAPKRVARKGSPMSALRRVAAGAGRCGRGLLYVALAALATGCVPVGARWQNMFSALGLLG